MIDSSLRWVDDRLGIAKGGRTFLDKIFPDHWSFMLGEIALYSFVVLIATGIFLSLFFIPSAHEIVYHGSYIPLRGERVSEAYASTVGLSFDVKSGLLMRQAHHWAADIFLGSIAVHMARVFFTGAFRKPREFNWCVGVILLVLTLLLSFTGYLLPDDQLGFWAVTVGTNMARATPLLGHEGPFGTQLGMTPYNDVRFALLGGSIVDANALLRSYIWHCIGIPIIASIFMGVHFWRVRKDGGISGPAPVQLASEIKPVRKI